MIGDSFGESSPTHFQLDLTQDILPIAVLALLGVLLALLLLERLLHRSPVHYLRAVFFVDLSLAIAASVFLIWASRHRFGTLGFLTVVMIVLVAKQLAEGVLLARIEAVAVRTLPAPAPARTAGRRAWLPVLPPFVAAPAYLLASWTDPEVLDASVAVGLLGSVLLLLAFAGVVVSIVLGIRTALRLPKFLKALGAPRRAVRLARFAWLHPAAWPLAALFALLAVLVFAAFTLLELDGADTGQAVLLVPFLLIQSAAVLGAANAPCDTGLKAAAERTAA
jgi:hypothetical protein